MTDLLPAGSEGLGMVQQVRPVERIPMLGVHAGVCGFQGHEGQAMFRVRACVLRIVIFFFLITQE